MVVAVPPIRESFGYRPAEPVPTSYPGTNMAGCWFLICSLPWQFPIVCGDQCRVMKMNEESIPNGLLRWIVLAKTITLRFGIDWRFKLRCHGMKWYNTLTSYSPLGVLSTYNQRITLLSCAFEPYMCLHLLSSHKSSPVIGINYSPWPGLSPRSRGRA
jgi:hypothetical protein